MWGECNPGEETRCRFASEGVSVPVLLESNTGPVGSPGVTQKYHIHRPVISTILWNFTLVFKPYLMM